MSSDFGITAKRSLARPPLGVEPPQAKDITTTASRANRFIGALHVERTETCGPCSRPPLCPASRRATLQQLIHHDDPDHHYPDDQPIVERRTGNLRERVAQHAENQRDRK